MRMSRIVAPLIAAIGAQLLPVSDAARAVPGLYSLPKTDFIWNWGSGELEQRRGAADIEISGGEAQFRCELTAQMRASSTMTPAEYRELETQLSTRLDFIYAVSEAMNFSSTNACSSGRRSTAKSTSPRNNRPKRRPRARQKRARRCCASSSGGASASSATTTSRVSR